MDVLKTIVFSRHGEIRSGWRVLMFLFLSFVFLSVLVAPILSLLPGSEFLPQLMLVLSLCAATFIMTRFVNKKPFGAVGLSLHSSTFRELGTGLMLGLVMMSSIYVVEMLCGYVALSWRGLPVWSAVWVICSSLALFGISALGEEIAFRGYFFQTLIQGITFLPATLLLAVVFAAAHARNPGVTAFSLVNIALAGVWFSVAYMKTRSLWLPFGLHWSWNFAQTTVFGFPTSGGDFPSQRVFDAVQAGPDWITGGTFGPEGGALATIALIAGTWVILKSESLAAPEGIITLDSIEDLLRPTNGSGEPTA